MADRIRYVNTASTAGGDGTTNDTSGANRAYPTLNAALAGEQGDISSATGSNERVVINCTGSSADTTAPVFNSTWKMDASGYVLVQPNTGQAHGGKYNTSVYRLELSTSTNATFSALPTTNEFRAVFQGIQIKITRTGTSGNNTVMFHFQSGMQSGSRLFLENCLFPVDDTGFSGTGAVRFCLSSTSNCRLDAGNCLFSGAKGGLSGLLSVSTPGQAEIYYCTFIGNVCALSGLSASWHRVKNCLFKGNTTDISGTAHSDSNYNTTDKASGMPGANSRHSQTFTFVDEGNGDYHLAPTDGGAKGFGVDLSSDPQYVVTTDVDGQPRAGSFDMGFDQYVPPSSMMWLLWTPMVATAGEQTYSLTVGATAVLRATFSKTVGTTAVLRATFSKTVSTSAVLRAAQTKTVSISAVLRATLTHTVTANAVLRATSSVTTASDAVLLESNTQTVATSAVLRATANLTVDTTAVLTAVADTFDLTTSAAAVLLECQYARPEADTFIGNWTDELGGTTNIYQSIDEITSNDADYIQSPENPTTEVYVLKLQDLQDPTVHHSHSIRYRYGKDTAGAALDLTVQLRQDYVNESNQGTLIKEWIHTDVSIDVTTAEQTLAEVDAANITNYTELYLRFVAETA